MRILHITADNIFLDNAYDQFKVVNPNHNDVVVWSKSKEIRKIKTNATVVSSLSEFHALVNISLYPVIILHSLNVEHANFINSVQLTDDQKIVWMLHGYEVYGLPIFNSNEIYSSKTRDNFLTKKGVKEFVKKTFRPLVEKVVNTDSYSIVKAAKKVNYLGILYKEEYEYIKGKLSLGLDWFQFTYYPLEKIVPNKTEQLSEYRSNILIGNSASESNNHIDVFHKLSEIGLLDDQKIICPLSYGNKEYATALIKEGKIIFGDNFRPLTDFMPIKGYNKVISRCSVAIMNHYRQQAVGTVLSMVYSGAKVFLSENNSLYHYLNRIGVSIFSIEKHLNTSKDLLPLNEMVQKTNKELIKSEINQEKLLIELKENLIKLSV